MMSKMDKGAHMIAVAIVWLIVFGFANLGYGLMRAFTEAF